MKISKQQILMILLLLSIGYVYSMYSGKLNQDTEKEERDLIQKFLAHDKYGQLVFLADSDFTIQMTQSKFPNVKLFFTSEFE